MTKPPSGPKLLFPLAFIGVDKIEGDPAVQPLNGHETTPKLRSVQ
jgi:hypothetical protein